MKKYLLYSILLVLIAIPANSSVMNSNIVTDGEGVTYISDHYLNNQKVHYKTYHGIGIMEGDIVLGPVEELEKRKEKYESKKQARSATITNGYRWPDGEIPYVFANHVSLTTQADTLQAMQQWMNTTPIRFVERTNEKYYVYITSYQGEGCKSAVGYGQQKRQVLNLESNCRFPEALHELGHTIGLYHEHNRADRDAYVNINWSNIKPDMRFAFQKYNTQLPLGHDIGTYDYDSIMHYGAYYFAIDKDVPTIEPYYTSMDSIGQKIGLSPGDIAGVQHMYHPYPAQLTSPSDKYRLPGRRVTFNWTYTGANNVYLTVGSVFHGDVSGKTSLTLNNLPIDGRDITVTLTTYTTSGTKTKTYDYKAFLPKPTKPTKPTIVSPTNIASSKVTVRWKDNSSNEKSFRIYRNGKYIKSVSAGTTSFTDSGLKPDTAYTYTIKAYNDAGYSAGITIKVKTKKNNDVPITYYIMN